MFVLIDIALILFASVLMTGSFFVIERTRRLKYVINLKIPKLALELITGVIYSGVFVLLQIIMQSIAAGFNIQIFLMGFVALVIVSDYRVAVFSFPLALIYYLLLNHVDAAMYANVIVFLSTSMVYIIVEVFIKGFFARLITYGVAIVLGLISLFVIAYPFDAGLNADTFEITSLGTLLIPLMVELIAYSIRVSISANILYESVNYDYGKFYRRSLKNSAIGRAVKERKVERAFYGVLHFGFDKQESEERDKEITESVLVEIQKAFPSTTVLFKADESNYGFFLPTSFKNKLHLSIEANNTEKRDVLDPLHHLEKILETVSKSFKTSFNTFVDVEVFSGVAVYGIQESSLSQLNLDAMFALKINEGKVRNRITIFDPLMYRNKVNDSHDLQALDRAIGLEDYVSRFTPIVDLRTGDTAFNYVTQINTNESEFIEEIRTFIGNTGMLNVFERYFAVDALSKASKYKGDLMMDYSVGIFDKKFNIKEFIRQLNGAKFSPKRLILVSDDYAINDLADLSLINETIKSLREHGIRFAVKGLEKVSLNMDYRLISSYDTYEELPKFKEEVVIYDLDAEEIADKAVALKINLMGGSLFEINVIPNNFDKQSKIYIEDIKSGKR